MATAQQATTDNYFREQPQTNSAEEQERPRNGAWPDTRVRAYKPDRPKDAVPRHRATPSCHVVTERAPAQTLLGDLGGQAVQASGPGLSWAAFISGASGSLALPCAGAARPCGGWARTTRAAGRTLSPAGETFLPSLSVTLFQIFTSIFALPLGPSVAFTA
jgi:hypothetical protein